MFLFIHPHHRQVPRRDAFLTQMPRHLLAQANRAAVTTCALAATDAARRTMLTFRAVRTGLAAEVPAFHNALHALALGDPHHIYIKDEFKLPDVQRRTRRHGGLGRQPNLAEKPLRRGLPRLLTVADQGLG